MTEKTANHVNDCERGDSRDLFDDRCRAANIHFDSLEDDTRAICLAVLAAGNYVADMIAAAHHDAHGTKSVGELP